MNSSESPDSVESPDEYIWLMGCHTENLEGQRLKYYAEKAFNLIFCDENNDMLEREVQCEPQDCCLHDRSSGIVSPQVQSCDNEIRKAVIVESKDLYVGEKVGKRHLVPPASFASFSLLTNCVSRRRSFDGRKINVLHDEIGCLKVAAPKLSTNAIIWLAGEKFVQLKSNHELLIGGHLSSGAFSGLAKDNRRDAELVFYLQAIVENVAGARKIHVIDLAIRDGNQHTILMQSLAKRSERSVKRLKITAIGTKSKKKIEETGCGLKSFAQSLKLPFTFNTGIITG